MATPRKRGPKSKIEKLDPGIRAEIDRLLFDEGRTVDDVAKFLKTLKLDDTPSRGSVARYGQNLAQMRANLSAMKTATEQLGKDFGDDESDQFRFLIQVAQTLAFRAMEGKSGVEAQLQLDELMMLMRGMRDLASARKTTLDTEEKIQERIRRAAEEARRAALTEAATVAESAATNQGLSADRVEQLKRDILGIRRKPE